MADSSITVLDVYGTRCKLATDVQDGVHTLKQAAKFTLSAGGNIAVQTSATGTPYVAFAAQACSQLTLVNDTGADIQWQQDGAGVALTLKDGTAFTIFGIENADQIGVRRKDTSTTQVTLAARWEA